MRKEEKQYLINEMTFPFNRHQGGIDFDTERPAPMGKLVCLANWSVLTAYYYDLLQCSLFHIASNHSVGGERK